MGMGVGWEFLAAWMRARFALSDRGATLVEYAMLTALIAVVCISAIAGLETATRSKFAAIGNAINGGS